MRYLTLGQPDTVSNFKYLLYQSSHPFLYELTGFRQVYGLNLCSCIKPLHTVVQHDIILHWIHCSDVHWSALHCTELFKSLFSSHPLSALGCLPAIIIVTSLIITTNNQHHHNYSSSRINRQCFFPFSFHTWYLSFFLHSVAWKLQNVQFPHLDLNFCAHYEIPPYDMTFLHKLWQILGVLHSLKYKETSDNKGQAVFVPPLR